MFPSAYLRTYWQMNVRPQVFVAMSFAEAYRRRFDDVISPAIRAVHVNGQSLEPFRVDFSKSGDSILTDIVDGIAHCQMFIADVSIMGHDSRSSHTYRNGNVMYEIGLAVACRQPTEILLIRDDQERFLFDVSTIPHVHLNFANAEEARTRLHELIIERLREVQFLNDARVQQVIARLSSDELDVIRQFGSQAPSNIWGFPQDGGVRFQSMLGIPRLLDKQIIRLVGTWQEGGGAYTWTQLGYVVAQAVLKHIPTLQGTKQVPDQKHE